MSIHFHYIHVDELSVWDWIASYQISHIDYAFNFLIRIIIEEDVLGLIISLVNK